MNKGIAFIRRMAGVLLLAALIPACGGGRGEGTLNPTVAPQIPTGFSGVGAPLRNVLRWDASPIATTYKLKRSLFSGGPYTDVAGASALTEPTFKDSGLQNGTAYYYVVSAANSFGVSPNSAELKVVPGFKAVQISGGLDFTAVVMLDGSVWTSGVNDCGQLGIPAPPIISTVFVEVPLPEPVIEVAAGFQHCLALTASGRVYAWGDNSFQELGHAGPSTDVPMEVAGVSDVRHISANYYSSLALLADGTVMAWGDNTYGQLGLGHSGGTSTATPTPVPGLSDILAVSAGGGFNLALRSNGTIAAWGFDQAGLLGTGVTQPPFGVVVPVVNLSNVVAISAGYNHSTALTDDGVVWTWGSNNSGQLGAGNPPFPSEYPLQVIGIPTIVGISTGYSQVLCVAADGGVWAWGDNVHGEVGKAPTPSATDQPTPIQTNGVSRIASVAAAYFHSLAVGDDGTVWGWGSDQFGQLGVGGGGTQLRPVPVPQIDSVAAISGASNHSLALRSDGTVWGWSYNRWGQTGNDTTSTELRAPARSGDVTGELINMVAVSSGGSSSMALKNNGTVWTWGFNEYGELGQGPTVKDLFKTTPAMIPTLSGITAIAMGGAHSLAVGPGGKVWGWGHSLFGAAGTGGVVPTYSPPLPVMTMGSSGLEPLTGIIAVSASYETSLALKSDHTVWVWGGNFNGELGLPATNPYSVNYAIQMPGLTGITAISSGGAGWSLALKDDGTVWAWGSNYGGQLGLDPNVVANSETPVQINLTDVIAIAAGGLHGLAIKSDHTVWAWGDNSHGQLGQGDFDPRVAPVQIAGLSGVTAVSAGDYFSLAITAEGRILGWGANDEGQLAIYPHTAAYSPIEIDH